MQGACGKTSGRSIFPHAPLRATSSGVKWSIWRAICNSLLKSKFPGIGLVGFALGGKDLRFTLAMSP